MSKRRLFLPQKCMLTSNEISIQTKLGTKITISKLKFKLVSMSPTEIIYVLNCLLRQNITQRDCFKGLSCTYKSPLDGVSVVRACLSARLFLGLNALYLGIIPPNNHYNCAISKPGRKQGHWKGLMNKTLVPIISSFNLANRWLCQWKTIEQARIRKPRKILLTFISCQRTLRLPTCCLE